MSMVWILRCSETGKGRGGGVAARTGVRTPYLALGIRTKLMHVFREQKPKCRVAQQRVVLRTDTKCLGPAG